MGRAYTAGELVGSAIYGAFGVYLVDILLNDKYDPNDTDNSKVIPFPGTKTKSCPAPNPEPDDPCERTRKALDNLYNQLVAGFLSAKNNEVMRQMWRKRAALFEDSVNEYNSTCPNRWPDYKRFNLRPGGDPFNLY